MAVLFTKCRPILAAAFIAVLATGCQTSGPQRTSLEAGESGYFRFPTTSLWNGKQIDIGGTLTFPDGVAEKVPMVLLAHSGDGVDYSERQWEDLYLEQGYAVFMLDYMRPRGVGPNSREYPRSGYDVYDALKVLATHPGVDADNVAIQGFSNGGTITASSLYPLGLAEDVPMPKAFILTYGGCNKIAGFHNTKDVQGSSFLMLVGDKDVAVRPEYCQIAADRFEKSGIDAKAIIFSNVYHGFDDIERKSVNTKWGLMVFKPDAAATQTSYDEATSLLARVFAKRS